MVQRKVCLCDGKYIGIETIYMIINGEQINIPEKLGELRAKSQNNELFCPCGCGSNMILVAGDKNLREQHFRLKDGAFNQECNVITEGKISADSKIVLKCWLDDKLKATDIESRVPIQAVDDTKRRYEFSFLSKEKKIALSYCHERVNLSDEKMELLEHNSQGIRIIYVVDSINGGCDGQYPEGLMKVQNKQGYCLLLTTDEEYYSKAMLKAVFYAKNIDGFWQEVLFADGHLSDFSIDDTGHVLFGFATLDAMMAAVLVEFKRGIEEGKNKRAEEEQRRAEKQKRLLEEEESKHQERQRLQEEAAKRRAELEEKRRIEEELRHAEI